MKLEKSLTHVQALWDGAFKESELFDAENQLLIARAGLWPCIELLLMHHRCAFASPTIRRTSEMMNLLQVFVPQEEEDLVGTPYGEVDEFYNLADERWDDLREAFALAASEDDVVGLIE